MPAIEIRRRPVLGDPVHVGGHEHEHSATDFIKQAPLQTGPVAYSLLRAAAFPLSGHRLARAQAASDGFFMALQKAREVARIDRERGERHWRQEGRLYLWDQIEILHEVCEDLVCVFESIRLAQQDPGLDLGLELLSKHDPAYTVIASEAFGNETWWRNQLGVEPDATRYSLLPPVQQAALDEVLQAAGARLSTALAYVRGTYTLPLHRIAARSRHGISLLDPEHGLAWVGRKEADHKADIEALDAGALVVADTERRTIVEYLVPVTPETYQQVRLCWNHASWLLEMLCGSIIGRDENPAGTTIPMDNLARLPASKEREEALIAYTGSDPELWARDGLRHRTTGAVFAAAERLALPNRAARRKRVKRTARRSKRR